MHVRPYVPQDYPTLKAWWEGYQFPVIAEDFLPVNGFVIDGLCAGFIYRTDSKICWLEWVVANPEADKDERRAALDLLISKATEFATSKGFKVVFTSVEHEGLIARYSKHGFVTTEKGMTNLLRVL